MVPLMYPIIEYIAYAALILLCSAMLFGVSAMLILAQEGVQLLVTALVRLRDRLTQAALRYLPAPSSLWQGRQQPRQ